MSVVDLNISAEVALLAIAALAVFLAVFGINPFDLHERLDWWARGALLLLSAICGVASISMLWRDRRSQPEHKTENSWPTTTSNPIADVAAPTRATATIELVNLTEVFKHLTDNLIRLYKGRPATTNIKNIAFDMQATAPWIINVLEANAELKNVSYKALMVNGSAKLIQEIAGGTSDIQTANIVPAVSRLWAFVEQEEFSLRGRNIDFEIRAYHLPPVLHGFMLNKEHVYLGLTRFSNKKIKGSTDTYFYLTYERSDTSAHLFEVYDSWFEYLWNRSEVVFQFSRDKKSCPLLGR